MQKDNFLILLTEFTWMCVIYCISFHRPIVLTSEESVRPPGENNKKEEETNEASVCINDMCVCECETAAHS